MEYRVHGILAATSAIDGIKHLVNVLCEPHWFLIIAVAGLIVFLIGYQSLTKPGVAATIAIVAVGLFVASCFDQNFVLIVKKPDNVPIVMLMVSLTFFLWLSFRQAAVNDRNIAEGKPLSEAGADDKVLVWPDLVYTELICLVICTAFLIVWAIFLRAPLEQPADPNVAPNPAKAPWYFLGLQEMLVYFDPWLAGVLLPGLIIVGLIAIPFMDKNPRGNGYYTFAERRFAITMFMFGFVILWVVLIIFGTFLRGPNWNFFGPYEYWDLHRPAALLNQEFHNIFWIDTLGLPLPDKNWGFIPSYVVRELPGIILLVGYFLLGPLVLRALFFRKLFRQIGSIRYGIMVSLLLVMLLMPIKMVLRWTLNLHYIVGITEWFLNI